MSFIGVQCTACLYSTYRYHQREIGWSIDWFGVVFIRHAIIKILAYKNTFTYPLLWVHNVQKKDAPRQGLTTLEWNPCWWREASYCWVPFLPPFSGVEKKWTKLSADRQTIEGGGEKSSEIYVKLKCVDEILPPPVIIIHWHHCIVRFKPVYTHCTESMRAKLTTRVPSDKSGRRRVSWWLETVARTWANKMRIYWTNYSFFYSVKLVFLN